MDLKQEFYFRGSNLGCLLIHGFTATAGHMRPLGEYLRDNGYTVLGILLPGHGTDPDDMAAYTYDQWYEAAAEGYRRLKNDCDKIVVIGHSMGGLLALKLAAAFPIDVVVTLAAAVKPTSKLLRYSGVLKYIKKYNYWEPKTYPPEQDKYMLGYDKYQIKAAHQLYLLIKDTIKLLTEILAPVLVVQAQHDKTVDSRSGEIIMREIRSEVKKLVWVENCGHEIPVELKGRQKFAIIEEFISKYS